jgi:hypothetical protein
MKFIPPGVAYLTQPYKKKCQSWEVTVLVRKVLLAVVCVVYPSSFSGSTVTEQTALFCQ